MKTVIYLDELLLTNFLAAAALLLGAGLLCARQCSGLRLMAGSAAAAAASLGILLPELPYDIDRVCEAVERRAKKGSNFSILAVAEGAINTEEARMKRKDWMAKRAEAGLGTTAIAANSLGVSAESLCYMAGYGIQDASLALVGQAVGANRRDMAKNFAWLCTGMGIGIMALTGVGMYIFAPNLMGIFTADAAVIALGAQVLRIEALAEPMFGASIVASGAMQGAGDSTGCFVLNLVSMWGIRLTLASLLAPHFGLVGVWMAMSFELTMRGVLFLCGWYAADGLDKGGINLIDRWRIYFPLNNSSPAGNRTAGPDRGVLLWLYDLRRRKNGEQVTFCRAGWETAACRSACTALHPAGL